MDLTRTEPESAVQRFYRMELMPGLFGDWTLVRDVLSGHQGPVNVH